MILIIGIITLLVSLFVSWKLKSKFKQYSAIGLRSGISGAEAAQQMLHDHGIYDVKIISVDGQLTDHYNPANKTVNLSRDVYYGRHAAAVAVASHECGHAVQHAKAYTMLQVRSALVPVQNVSANVLNVIMLISIFGGMFLYKAFPMDQVLLLIIGCHFFITLFAFITLPVEFDASSRALAWMDNNGIVTSKEHSMAKDALNWAALTYVVAALGSLAQLMYYLSIFMGRRDD
ncbi:MAG: zinc metallopeptidase [Cytophagales bacterium]|nr:zinc metallopeptidase [Cytophagales bacterium]